MCNNQNNKIDRIGFIIDEDLDNLNVSFSNILEIAKKSVNARYSVQNNN